MYKLIKRLIKWNTKIISISLGLVYKSYPKFKLHVTN